MADVVIPQVTVDILYIDDWTACCWMHHVTSLLCNLSIVAQLTVSLTVFTGLLTLIEYYYYNV